MNVRTLRYFTIADVTLLPAFILWFIWQLQFTARWTWVVFVGLDDFQFRAASRHAEDFRLAGR